MLCKLILAFVPMQRPSGTGQEHDGLAAAQMKMIPADCSGRCRSKMKVIDPAQEGESFGRHGKAFAARVAAVFEFQDFKLHVEVNYEGNHHCTRVSVWRRGKRSCPKLRWLGQDVASRISLAPNRCDKNIRGLLPWDRWRRNEDDV